MPLIDCKNLSLAYGKRTVIENIDFSVDTGDYLCILGENGSGKSTLLKAILGLVAPIGGQIIFDSTLLRTDIGYLPQQTELSEDFPASVFEVILSGMLERKKIRLFYTKAEKSEADNILKKLNIFDLKRRSYSELSGGQKQRILLARSICAAKKLLILDEPTANLDPQATDEFYKIISELNKSGITIIMVSHDVNSATKHANKILSISHDDISFMQASEDYLNQCV